MPKLRHLLGPVAVLAVLATASTSTYTVVPGDTVSEIARDRGTTVQELVAANGLSDPDHVRAGQTLAIPAPAAEGAAADASVGALAARGDPGVEALIERKAREHGWSPAFVKALAWQESGWSQDRVSHAGAVGIMQVMPATGDFISTQLLGRELDLHDPHDNVLAGVVYLQHLWERTDGDAEWTLASYYQGYRSVQVNGRYVDTERYIANVLALRERFR